MHYLFPEQIQLACGWSGDSLFEPLPYHNPSHKPEKTADISCPTTCFPPEMTLKEQAGEFHTDDMYLPRSGHGHATREINNIK